MRLLLLSGITSWATVVYRVSEPVGAWNRFRWLVRGEAARLAPQVQIGLSECPSYDSDILGAIRSAWASAGIEPLDGAKVVVKPNLVDHLDGHPLFTDARVVRALLSFLREEQKVKSVVVAEGTTFRRDSESVLIETDYREMLDSMNVEFVDLNYDDVVPVPLTGGYARLSQLFMARTVVEADALISVPKLKTHHWAYVSASIKNLFGIVPGIKYGWPKNTLHMHGIPAFLAELLDSLPTRRKLAVVDGIVGMQGDGPLFGTAVNVGALVAGADLAAVDATCSRLMGIDPRKVDYLSFAEMAGLGQIDGSRIEVRGARIDALWKQFQPPPLAG